jgi:hypothetical protein
MGMRRGANKATGALRQRHDLLRYWLQALDHLEDFSRGAPPASKSSVPQVSGGTERRCAPSPRLRSISRVR